MSTLNILYQWYTLKQESYIKVLGFRLDRIDSYRTCIAVLLLLSSYKQFILADLIRMFRGSHRVMNKLLPKLVEHGYVKKAISKRSTNIQPLTSFTAYTITPLGKQCVRRFEYEMQIIVDKARK